MRSDKRTMLLLFVMVTVVAITSLAKSRGADQDQLSDNDQYMTINIG